MSNVGKCWPNVHMFYEDVRLLFSETCHNVMREIVDFEAVRNCGKVENHVVFFVLSFCLASIRPRTRLAQSA